jgi:hypothetical protein
MYCVEMCVAGFFYKDSHVVNLIEIAHHLSIDDVPEQIRCVAERCSIMAAVRLTVECPGIDIYVPAAGKKTLDRLYIQQNYTGSNAGSIAVRLGYTRSKIAQYAKLVEANPIPENWEMPNLHMRLVAERCGRDVAIALMQHFQAVTIYIPFDGVYRIKKAYVARFFDGSNAVELAADLGVTERFVRKAVADSYASNVVQLKMDLFDEQQKAAM